MGFQMDPSQRKEQFSYAYLLAVTSTAGFTLSDPRVDQDSVDTTVYARGQTGPIGSPRLDVQLKCRAEDDRRRDPLRVSIKKKNYDDLRIEATMCPKILAVLFVPEHDERWTEHTADYLLSRYCCYWTTLTGMPPIEGEATSTTVDVPQSRMLNVEQLREMMARISNDGRL